MTLRPGETMHHAGEDRKQPVEIERRTALSRIVSLAMGGGLLAGYGAFAAIAARYLYPARPQATHWLYVIDVARMQAGDSIAFRTPAGAVAAIARRGELGAADDFIALSSTCPHLGCQVHWEANHNRFFCPCHNGAFDPSGKAIAGPPFEAGQSLPRFPLKVEGGLLFIEVPLEQLAQGPASEVATRGCVEAPGGPPGPGHDPCLYARAGKRTA
jgi:cytochrome b6-f complex iron-sulfur subunit